MSAWYCGDEHIAYLLAAGMTFAREASRHSPMSWREPGGETKELTAETFRETGQMLRDRNLRNLRYLLEPETQEHCIPEDTAFRVEWARFQARHRPDPVQVLKATECLRYQCNDGGNWRDSEAEAFIDELMGLAIGRLPGYGQADWGPPKDVNVRLRMMRGGGEPRRDGARMTDGEDE